MARYIIITGNPADGFAHYGPFDDPEWASEWGDRQRFDWDFWVIELLEVKNED